MAVTDETTEPCRAITGSYCGSKHGWLPRTDNGTINIVRPETKTSQGRSGEAGSRSVECAVYYPLIVPPVEWLKQSLLYWDRVASVVHREFWNDPDPVLLWLADHGAYESIYTDDLSEQAAEMLAEELFEVLVHLDEAGLDWKPMGRGDTQLNYGKLPRYIELYFEGIGVLKRGSTGLFVNSEILSVLICLAAKYACVEFSSTKGVYSLVTSLNQAHRICHAPLAAEDSASALNIVIKSILPTIGESIGFEDILDFRSNYRGQQLELRQFLHSSVSQRLARGDDIRRIVSDIAGEVEAERLRLGQLMRRRNWHLSALAVATTAITVVGEAYFHGATEWVLDGIGSTVVGATLSSVRSGPTPKFSYVHAADDRFGGEQ